MGSAAKLTVAAVPEGTRQGPVVLRELRCKGCRRLVGYTSRPQPVPVQCTDPFCALEPPSSSTNEERDSFMWHLFVAEMRSPADLGELFGLSRQGVARVLASR